MAEIDLGSIKGPQGITGPAGAPASVSVGAVTTLDAGKPATVTNSGTPLDVILDFGIPRGDVGDGTGDMLKSVYDADNDGVVDNTKRLDGKLAEQFSPAVHTHVADAFTAGHVPVITAGGQLKDSGKTVADLGTQAAQTLIDEHVSDNANPHGVTAAQIGAAAASHNHDAAGITSGALPVLRGGTGASTAAQALKNLGAASSSHVHANMAVVTYGTSDLVGEVPALATGTMYLMYE